VTEFRVNANAQVSGGIYDWRGHTAYALFCKFYTYKGHHVLNVLQSVACGVILV
jgi:hypothetical protein